MEAGLRSFNRAMPEEIDRVVADHLSKVLFCPTATAVKNLEKEGIASGVYQVGDVMHDALLHFAPIAAKTSRILQDHDLREGNYLLCTVHRAGNTDNPEILAKIFKALATLATKETVVFPVHPRTRNRIPKWKSSLPPALRLIDPVPYLDMLRLEKGARLILTDSGGVEKEAAWLKIPCITL